MLHPYLMIDAYVPHTLSDIASLQQQQRQLLNAELNSRRTA
jgi:hypothetical protein